MAEEHAQAPSGQTLLEDRAERALEVRVLDHYGRVAGPAQVIVTLWLGDRGGT
jgi:hypothetical protein